MFWIFVFWVQNTWSNIKTRNYEHGFTVGILYFRYCRKSENCCSFFGFLFNWKSRIFRFYQIYQNISEWHFSGLISISLSTTDISLKPSFSLSAFSSFRSFFLFTDVSKNDVSSFFCVRMDGRVCNFRFWSLFKTDMMNLLYVWLFLTFTFFYLFWNSRKKKEFSVNFEKGIKNILYRIKINSDVQQCTKLFFSILALWTKSDNYRTLHSVIVGNRFSFYNFLYESSGSQ